MKLDISKRPKPNGIPPAKFYNNDVAREHMIWKRNIKRSREIEQTKMNMLTHDNGNIFKSEKYRSIEMVCNSFGGVLMFPFQSFHVIYKGYASISRRIRMARVYQARSLVGRHRYWKPKIGRTGYRRKAKIQDSVRLQNVQNAKKMVDRVNQ